MQTRLFLLRVGFRMPFGVPVRLLVAGLLMACSVVRAAEGGSISGPVSNVVTGNLLEGAKVEIRALGRSTVTDSNGRYVLNGVPAGTHEIAASYVGLDAVR